MESSFIIVFKFLSITVSTIAVVALFTEGSLAGPGRVSGLAGPPGDSDREEIDRRANLWGRRSSFRSSLLHSEWGILPHQPVFDPQVVVFLEEAYTPSSATCGVCAEPIGGCPVEHLVVCACCQRPNHLDCFAYLGWCSTFGCGGELAVSVHDRRASHPFYASSLDRRQRKSSPLYPTESECSNGIDRASNPTDSRVFSH